MVGQDNPSLPLPSTISIIDIQFLELGIQLQNLLSVEGLRYVILNQVGQFPQLVKVHWVDPGAQAGQAGVFLLQGLQV